MTIIKITDLYFRYKKAPRPVFDGLNLPCAPASGWRAGPQRSREIHPGALPPGSHPPADQRGVSRQDRGGRGAHHHLPAPAAGRAGGDSAAGFRGPALLHPGGPGVAFGPENLGLPREELRHRVAECLALVGLDGLDDRDPPPSPAGRNSSWPWPRSWPWRRSFWCWTNPPPISIRCGWRNSWPPWTASAKPGTLPWCSWEKTCAWPASAPGSCYWPGVKSWRMARPEVILREVERLRGLGLNPPELHALFHDLGQAALPLPWRKRWTRPGPGMG